MTTGCLEKLKVEVDSVVTKLCAALITQACNEVLEMLRRSRN